MKSPIHQTQGDDQPLASPGPRLHVSTAIGSTGYRLLRFDGTLVGALEMDVDGYYKFWPDVRPGYWTQEMLEALAKEMASLNAEWDETVRRECEKPIPSTTF